LKKLRLLPLHSVERAGVREIPVAFAPPALRQINSFILIYIFLSHNYKKTRRQTKKH
jgi:hypothetical protein